MRTLTGSLLQVREVRVPRAEVVERDVHAHLGEAPQRLEEIVVGADQGGLGDFEAERAGFESEALQDVDGVGDEARVGELHRGQVHVDAQGPASS